MVYADRPTFSGPGTRKEEQGKILLLIEVHRYLRGVSKHSAEVFFCEAFVTEDWDEPSDFEPEIDEIQVPEDYLIPLFAFNKFNGDEEYGRYMRINVISERGSHTYNSVIPKESSDKDASMFTQLIKVQNIPYNKGVPFYISVGLYTNGAGPMAIGGIGHIIKTPIFKVTGRQMEQYAFLSPEGIYYNIPMRGTHRHIPEYDISAAKTASGYQKSGGGVSDLHEQNSGPLTRKTALALVKYLCSDMVYHWDSDRQIFRRIVVENPSVSISTSTGVHSLTFQWRYDDNNNYYNY